MKKYCIIGNGTAAIGCIEGIRSIDKSAEITVISGENHHVYGRPLISYMLEGKTDTERMKYRPSEFYNENGCTALFGKKAVAVDEKKKTVTLDDKTVVGFDALCVATGSSPFVPYMEGYEKVSNKFAFMTVDDALAIEENINSESRVLIVGAGLIGLKCAEGLHGRVKSITVCDLSDRVLSSILDNECACIVSKHLEDNGISLMLGDSVMCFEGNTAHMKSGADVSFDALVTAVGVRPNISLIKDIGGSCGRAISVDDHMRTSLADIYAAGDCTESLDISSGTVKVMALLPNAYMQGKCAGINMAGKDSAFDNAIPMNSIGFFGLHVMTAGSMPEGCEVYEEKSENQIKKLFVKDGIMKGFVLVGNVERAGIYTNMIRSRISIDCVDYEMLKEIPEIFALGEKYCGKVLKSVV